jgi:hypothetical protein
MDDHQFGYKQKTLKKRDWSVVQSGKAFNGVRYAISVGGRYVISEHEDSGRGFGRGGGREEGFEVGSSLVFLLANFQKN